MFFPQQLRDGPLEKYWGWGEGGQKSKKNFSKKLLTKNVFLRILAKQNICPREKRRFPPYMNKKILASLKIPTPQHFSNGPSLRAYYTFPSC